MAELEKEVVRLRATERSLRDAVSNKLLLEEQVHVLSTKVETLQPVQQELHEAKVLFIYIHSKNIHNYSVQRYMRFDNFFFMAQTTYV